MEGLVVGFHFERRKRGVVTQENDVSQHVPQLVLHLT